MNSTPLAFFGKFQNPTLLHVCALCGTTWICSLKFRRHLFTGKCFPCIYKLVLSSVYLRRYERLGNCSIVPSNFEFKTPLFYFLGNLSEILGLIRVRQHFDVDSFGSTLPQYCSASFSTVITQKQSGPLKFLIKIQFTEYQGEAMTLTKKNKGTNYTYIHSSPWEW